MRQFTQAIEISLNTQNWYSALALALTLPDICGKIDYPDLHRATRLRYSKWFDMYVGEEYKVTIEGETITFLTGNDCYALRCSYLHEGSNNVSEQEASEIITEKFVLMFSQGIKLHKVSNEGKIVLFLPDFCMDIVEGVLKWLNVIENEIDETRRNKNNSLMKIYLPDSHFGNMVFSQIGDLWEET